MTRSDSLRQGSTVASTIKKKSTEKAWEDEDVTTKDARKIKLKSAPKRKMTRIDVDVNDERYARPVNLEEDKIILGICGLTNLGNTCFFNSCMQCLNSTRDIVVEYSDMKIPKQMKVNTLFYKFLCNMRTDDEDPIFKPKDLFYSISR